MKIAVHNPFGSLSEEAGVIYLLARYLRRIFPEIVQLRCGGAFSLCDRDAENSWRRGFHTCFQCMQDQSDLAGWADLGVASLTSYLEAEELIETRKWVSFADAESLAEISFKGIVPFPYIRGSIKNRFGIDDPQLHNHHHEQMVRRLMLSAVRTCLATRRFNDQFKPGLSIVAGGDDFVSHSVLGQSRSQGIPVALVRWDIAGRAVKVFHPQSNEVFSCGLVLEGLSSMRGEIKTWPLELLNIIEDLAAFLDINTHQLPLPVASAAQARH